MTVFADVRNFSILKHFLFQNFSISKVHIFIITGLKVHIFIITGL